MSEKRERETGAPMPFARASRGEVCQVGGCELRSIHEVVLSVGVPFGVSFHVCQIHAVMLGSVVTGAAAHAMCGKPKRDRGL